jgi:hypothetical protein
LVKDAIPVPYGIFLFFTCTPLLHDVVARWSPEHVYYEIHDILINKCVLSIGEENNAK